MRPRRGRSTHRPRREVTGSQRPSGRVTAGEAHAMQGMASEARGPVPDLGHWLWTPWRPECSGQIGDFGADAWVRAPLPPDQSGRSPWGRHGDSTPEAGSRRPSIPWACSPGQQCEARAASGQAWPTPPAPRPALPPGQGSAEKGVRSRNGAMGVQMACPRREQKPPLLCTAGPGAGVQRGSGLNCVPRKIRPSPSAQYPRM